MDTLTTLHKRAAFDYSDTASRYQSLVGFNDRRIQFKVNRDVAANAMIPQSTIDRLKLNYPPLETAHTTKESDQPRH
jgi:hypothetical protein